MNLVDLTVQISLSERGISAAKPETSVSDVDVADRWGRLKIQLEQLAGADGLTAHGVAAENEMDLDDLKYIELVNQAGTRVNRPKLLFAARGSEFGFEVTPAGLKRVRIPASSRH